ncbi:TIGR04104 family putative zinc finger protein [Gracilibacillus orientalis]|uniref:TIGR04104 family putative zinc finger protein n=1 Tax=Gracilibacillus orientalis TaxID=334253 RepID=UPI000B84BF23
MVVLIKKRGDILQKCSKCNRHFRWAEIYNSFVWSYKPIECNKCGTEHRITISGRFTCVFLIIVPMLIFTNFLSPFENFFVTLAIGLSLLIIGSLLTPFFVTYREKL